METLTIKELAPYLPYGLKCEILNYKSDYVGEKYGIIKGYYFFNDKPHFKFNNNDFAGKDTSLFKPLLRPLSEIKNFKEYEFTEYFYSRFNMDSWGEYMGDIPYSDMEKLFEYHFDVFSLIDKGLAIDLSTIKETVK